MQTNNPEGGSRRATLGLVALGLISYSGFMLANLPASIVWKMVPASLSQTVNLHAIEGSIWAGSALVKTKNAHINELLARVHWQLEPLALFTGTVRSQLRMGDSFDPVAVSGEISASFSGIVAHNVAFDLRAQDILPSVSLPFTASGNVTGEIDHLELTPQGQCVSVQGALAITKTHIQSNFGNVELDKLTAQPSCTNNTWQFAVTQQSSQLNSQGTFTLTPPNRYGLKATVETNSQTPKAITQGLSMVAKSVGANTWQISF